MKKFLFILALVPILLVSFKLAIDKTSATVSTEQGVSIFIMSKPTQPNEYLGTVKVGVTWSSKPEEQLSNILKKLKKEYPTADGIVFTSIDMQKADAIKFKE